MVDMDARVIKLRRTLVIIILATLPCYLLGTIVLWVGSAAKNSNTPTPEISTVIITATPQPSETLALPTAFPTLTASLTPTITHTPTHTATPPATRTATYTPTITPTFTLTLTPTSIVTATIIPTETSTSTAIPIQITAP